MDLTGDNGGGTADDLLGGAGGGDGGGAAAGGAGADGAGAGTGDAGAGGAGGEGSGGEAGDPAWLATISPEPGEGDSASLQDWVKSVGAKDVNALAKIARDNQRALRDSGRVKVPGEGAAADEVTAFRSAIGVPEDPKGYAVPELKGADGNPVPLNTPFVDRVLASAHKHGVPKAAMDALLADEVAAQVADHDDKLKAQTQAANDHVKSWGADKDAKIAAVNAAAKEAGLTREDMQFLRAMPSGVAKMLDMLAKFGSSFSEDSLIRGDRQNFGVNAADAQKELDAMKADPAIGAKVKVPGSAENQRWQRLQAAVKAGVRAASGDNDFGT